MKLGEIIFIFIAGWFAGHPGFVAASDDDSGAEHRILSRRSSVLRCLGDCGASVAYLQQPAVTASTTTTYIQQPATTTTYIQQPVASTTFVQQPIAGVSSIPFAPWGAPAVHGGFSNAPLFVEEDRSAMRRWRRNQRRVNREARDYAEAVNEANEDLIGLQYVQPVVSAQYWGTAPNGQYASGVPYSSVAPFSGYYQQTFLSD
uniref:BZIP domain-containing protein n=1 Tax=Chromera velia CCMP2878 TaxID=1169474 RepID=A0A0G4GW33_9ALVE|mmetsp:Transcript_20941/g.41802  ORF Transcript_20941/g.41802 Transcript_20941/m.41802 type:complete len:203 (+) Transcript_20941:243-851(+)|eukprot:Cvel_23607.t1-p1 / transcript=Cvel_23607.t1 / gene=Cvel_23607 / organism=Chromera_velia_CCMP2878 / gene_product=hypothetical protein / transcript_product=hypothetical protein / location=Cvel_scaffold2451:21878-23222(-) / protein_length=202 / sequence_SO=supercontig / SO=protein_coding / is_pseudo=false